MMKRYEYMGVEEKDLSNIQYRLQEDLRFKVISASFWENLPFDLNDVLVSDQEFARNMSDVIRWSLWSNAYSAARILDTVEI